MAYTRKISLCVAFTILACGIQVQAFKFHHKGHSHNNLGALITGGLLTLLFTKQHGPSYGHPRYGPNSNIVAVPQKACLNHGQVPIISGYHTQPCLNKLPTVKKLSSTSGLSSLHDLSISNLNSGQAIKVIALPQSSKIKISGISHAPILNIKDLDYGHQIYSSSLGSNLKQLVVQGPKDLDYGHQIYSSSLGSNLKPLVVQGSKSSALQVLNLGHDSGKYSVIPNLGEHDIISGAGNYDGVILDGIHSPIKESSYTILDDSALLGHV